MEDEAVIAPVFWYAVLGRDDAVYKTASAYAHGLPELRAHLAENRRTYADTLQQERHALLQASSSSKNEHLPQKITDHIRWRREEYDLDASCRFAGLAYATGALWPQHAVEVEVAHAGSTTAQRILEMAGSMGRLDIHRRAGGTGCSSRSIKQPNGCDEKNFKSNGLCLETTNGRGSCSRKLISFVHCNATRCHVASMSSTTLKFVSAPTGASHLAPTKVQDSRGSGSSLTGGRILIKIFLSIGTHP